MHVIMDQSKNSSSSTVTATTCPSQDLFLTSEERYDVYCVKSKERPHLLLHDHGDDDANDEKNGDGNNDGVDELHESLLLRTLPLMDGCDIPNWRKEKMISSSISSSSSSSSTSSTSLLEAALNVGIGCTLLRRESQLPLPLMYTTSRKERQQQQQTKQTKWERLRDLLTKQPSETKTVERISYGYANSPLYSSDDHENGEHDNSQQRQQQHQTQQQQQHYHQKRFSKWEQDNVPVIIINCVTKENGWNVKSFLYDNLLNKFSTISWRFSDTHGEMMTLQTYHKYVTTEGLLDDSPLAIYDSEFGNVNDSPMNRLLQYYTVPQCFSYDLFELAATNATTSITETQKQQGDDDDDDDDTEEIENDNHVNNNNSNTRPPHRWILMGPPRSGTGLHIDPLYTNAWVTLIQGLKRWILIPPHLLKQLPAGAGLVEPQIPSIIWFERYYQQVCKLNGIIEILQQPGETVFVPNGWPHLVLNLQHTVAVTHNYASEYGPFERMWEQIMMEEPEFAQRWYQGLCLHRPDLAYKIQSTNNNNINNNKKDNLLIEQI